MAKARGKLNIVVLSWERKCWTTLSIKELLRETCCGHCSGWTKLTGWFRLAHKSSFWARSATVSAKRDRTKTKRTTLRKSKVGLEIWLNQRHLEHTKTTSFYCVKELFISWTNCIKSKLKEHAKQRTVRTCKWIGLSTYKEHTTVRNSYKNGNDSCS